MCVALFGYPAASRQRRPYRPGPLTANSTTWASRSVVAGSTTNTLALESGSTVVRQ